MLECKHSNKTLLLRDGLGCDAGSNVSILFSSYSFMSDSEAWLELADLYIGINE